MASSAGGLSAHILPTSATMIGVCMTVMSIGHLGPRDDLRLLIDRMLAIDALVFLASAVLSVSYTHLTLPTILLV